MAMNDRDRRALLWGGALVAAAVLYRVVLSPAVDRWGEARAEGALYTQRLEQAENKLERRDVLFDRLADRFGPAVTQPLQPLEQVRVAFPQAVQAALGRAGVQPQQVEVQGVRRLRGVTGVSTLSLRIQANVGDASIARLFNELRNCGHTVVIDSVNLSMAQPGQRQQWQLMLSLSTPALEQEQRS